MNRPKSIIGEYLYSDGESISWMASVGANGVKLTLSKDQAIEVIFKDVSEVVRNPSWINRLRGRLGSRYATVTRVLADVLNCVAVFISFARSPRPGTKSACAYSVTQKILASRNTTSRCLQHRNRRTLYGPKGVRIAIHIAYSEQMELQDRHRRFYDAFKFFGLENRDQERVRNEFLDSRRSCRWCFAVVTNG